MAGIHNPNAKGFYRSTAIANKQRAGNRRRV